MSRLLRCGALLPVFLFVTVQPLVLGRGERDEVARIVVPAISVAVVDVITLSEPPAVRSFPDEPVFGHVAPGVRKLMTRDEEQAVTVAVDLHAAFPRTSFRADLSARVVPVKESQRMSGVLAPLPVGDLRDWCGPLAATRAQPCGRDESGWWRDAMNRAAMDAHQFFRSLPMPGDVAGLRPRVPALRWNGASTTALARHRRDRNSEAAG